MKYFSILFVFIVLFLSCNKQHSQEPTTTQLNLSQEFTFRGLPWGSKVETVTANEGQPSDTYIDDNGDIELIYDSISNIGTEAEMKILFKNNIMVGAKYEFELWENDSPSPENVLKSIELNLKNLYGDPTEQRHLPKNTLYSDAPESWDFSWTFLRTRITFIIIKYEYDEEDIDSYFRGTITYGSDYINAFGGL